MFRFRKTLDTITLFHKASSPASVKVANLMKQVSANASVTATHDEASDNSGKTKVTRDPFELNITEDLPTMDQVQTILGYVGTGGVSKVIKGASNEQEALKLFKEGRDKFHRPMVVDWNNGKAVSGDNESELMRMINEKK
jgi:hypothetical protein